MTSCSRVAAGARRVALALTLAIAAGHLGAQEPAPQDRLAALEQLVRQLQGELGGLKGELQQVRSEAATRLELDEALDELDEALMDLTVRADAARGGTTRLLLAGDALVRFTDRGDRDSSFTAALNPHFYWQLDERTLFGAGVEIELQDDVSELFLEWAQVFFTFDNDVTLGLGKFLMPFGTFQENIHSPYINKLPDEPLGVANDGALVPLHDLGIQVRGPLLTDLGRFNYVLYVANGPELDTGADDPKRAGLLTSENFDDNNNGKAVGGRIGYLPFPAMEIGYSFLKASVGASDSALGDVDAVLHGVDFSWAGPVQAGDGHLDARAEWVLSDVDAVDFGAGAFDNERQGGYAQLAYRPTGADSDLLRDMEFVVRFDELDQPSGGPVADEQRWTVGVNYYTGPSSVFKLALQNRRQDGVTAEGEEDGHAVLFEYSIGF